MIIEDDNALCTTMSEMFMKWGFDISSHPRQLVRKVFYVQF